MPHHLPLSFFYSHSKTFNIFHHVSTSYVNTLCYVSFSSISTTTTSTWSLAHTHTLSLSHTLTLPRTLVRSDSYTPSASWLSLSLSLSLSLKRHLHVIPVDVADASASVRAKRSWEALKKNWKQSFSPTAGFFLRPRRRCCRRRRLKAKLCYLRGSVDNCSSAEPDPGFEVAWSLVLLFSWGGVLQFRSTETKISTKNRDFFLNLWLFKLFGRKCSSLVDKWIEILCERSSPAKN